MEDAQALPHGRGVRPALAAVEEDVEDERLVHRPLRRNVDVRRREEAAAKRAEVDTYFFCANLHSPTVSRRIVHQQVAGTAVQIVARHKAASMRTKLPTSMFRLHTCVWQSAIQSPQTVKVADQGKQKRRTVVCFSFCFLE